MRQGWLRNSLPVLLRVSLGLLLGLALWFRITSLEALPELCGDEAWYGCQIARMFHRQPFALRTFSGNPLNPFFISMIVGLVAVARPSAWLIRVPAVLSGLVGIGLTYSVGKRALDRPTAAIAAVLLAILPVSIIFSRTGFDYSQLPLFGMLALFCAFRGNAWGTLLSFIAGVWVHPTGVFVLPAVVAVFLTQCWCRTAGDSAARRRLIVGTLALSVLALLVLGLFIFRRGYVHGYYKGNHYESSNWGQILTGFPQFLLALDLSPHEVPFWEGWIAPASRTMLWLQDGLFWGTLGVLAFFGVRRLLKRQDWNRLALLAGTVVSIAGFHVVAGAHVLLSPSYRYGYFLVAPVVLSVACLIEALLPAASDEARSSQRYLQLLAFSVLGGVLLFCTKWNWFDPRNRDSREQFWTLRTESHDSYKQALRVISRDVERIAQTDPKVVRKPVVIIAEDYWTYRPLQYYAWPMPNVQVYSFAKAAVEEERYRTDVGQILVAGGYAVGYRGGPIDKMLKNAPQERVKRWNLGGHSPKDTTVFRVVRDEELASAQRAGTQRR